MSDHEFEKQVRQKLDDLRLTPTATAWEKIEQEIRVTKRRRAPLFWLPLILLSLGAGGYFIAKNLTAEEISVSRVQPAEQAAPQATDHSSSSPNSKKQETSDKRQKIYTSPNGKASNPGVDNNSASIRQHPQQKPRPERRSVSSESTQQGPEGRNAGDESTVATRSMSSLPVEDKDAALNRPPQISSGERGLHSSEMVLRPDYSFITGGSEVSTFIGGVQTGSLRNLNTSDGPAPAPPMIIHRNKWSFGITGFAGVSGFNEGELFDLSNALTTDMPVQSARYAPAYTPFKIQPGFSYAAGVVAKREISSKFHITAGLNYLLMSTRYKVGNKVYGSQAVNAAPVGFEYVRNFFTLDQHVPKDYNNTYHFAELPVSLHTRIIKSQKLPVYWNTGVSYSRLIHTNSKMFDGSTGVYYSNEKQLNKSQFAITTGFDFVIFGKSAHPLWIGPSARYNATKLLNDNAGTSRNLLSAGLNMKLFLK